MSQNEKTTEADKSPKAWFEMRLGDDKINLNLHGTTPTGLQRFVSKGTPAYAIYVGPESRDLALYQLSSNGESNQRERVAALFLNDGVGKESKKPYFFLANNREGVTLNLHGNAEPVNEIKAALRAMSLNVKAAIEAAESKKAAEAAPEPDKKPSRRPKP